MCLVLWHVGSLKFSERFPVSSLQDYEEPLMFCLNEEDEEEDALQPIFGKDSIDFYL